MIDARWLTMHPAFGLRRGPTSGIPSRRVAVLAAAVAMVLGGPVRAATFMPTGDSITQGIGSDTDLGFRPPLFTALNAIGTFDFVGSDACAFGDPPYEGFYFAGRPIGDFLPGGPHDLADIVPDAQPEIIAIHLGTNDVNSTPGPYGPWSLNHSVPSGNATGRLAGVVQHALSFPGVDRVILSRILPIIGRDEDVATFNREVVRIVLDFRNGAVTGNPEPVHLADHYLRFTSNPNFFADWMADDLHPNDSGYDQMSSVYGAAVNAAMNDGVAPDRPRRPRDRHRERRLDPAHVDQYRRRRGQRESLVRRLPVCHEARSPAATSGTRTMAASTLWSAPVALSRRTP